MRLYAYLLLAVNVFIAPAQAGETIAGPVLADVVKVRDGDSVDVVAHVWPGTKIHVSVRIRGIDAAELNAGCPYEKEMALAARQKLRELIGLRPIVLQQVSGGKYFGRVLSHVGNEAGQDIATAMLESGLVRPYKGRKRQPWCPQSAKAVD